MKFRFGLDVLFFICCAISLASCTSKSIEEIVGVQGCDTTATTYAAVIKPILDANCNTAGCHTASSLAGGYNFETFTSLQPAALGPRFLGAIRHEAGFSPMPKGITKLDDCQIKKIEIWVANGALNN